MAQRLRLSKARVATLAVFASATMPAGAEAVQDGAALYRQHCAACHGARLEGEPDWRVPRPDGTLPAPPHDVTGHTWHHGDGLLRDYTQLGGTEAMRRLGIEGFRSGMPAFAGVLSDDEIRAVLGFIKSSWGERERAFQSAVTAQEQE